MNASGRMRATTVAQQSVTHTGPPSPAILSEAQLHLPSTTALSTLNPEGRKLALLSGANVVMPNVSPQEFRSLYQIYPDKYCINDPLDDHWEELHRLIHSLGRTVGTDYGHNYF